MISRIKIAPFIYGKGDLYIAVTLYKTVIQRFPKGDHYMQVWL